MPFLPALLVSAAAALTPAPSDADLASIKHELAHGLWNARIHAVHRLDGLGSPALPLLEFAADDADWQVRMTAVHFLGRAGIQAIPALAERLREEPCRHVRITALNWLGSMGAPAAAHLERALEDESSMLRLTDRYWLEKMGRSSPSEPGELAAAKQEDLGACADSPAPGRLRNTHRASGAPPAGSAPKAEPQARQQRSPETLPPGPPTPQRSEMNRSAAPETPEQLRRNIELDALLAAGVAEKMPPGAAPPPRPEAAQPRAVIEADAGSAKSAHDPLPDLIGQLESADWRKRARAADELGRRGGQAAAASKGLVQALADKNRRVRASAALALGNIGDARNIGGLIDALADADEDVRWSAAVALGRIDHPRARKAFRRYARQASRPAP